MRLKQKNKTQETERDFLRFVLFCLYGYALYGIKVSGKEAK